SAGTLALPFTAGLRRGWLRGRVDVTAGAAAGASRVTLTVEERHAEVQWGAVVILLVAAGGGLLAAAWPFVPELLPAAPFGVLLAIGGWLLVVSRLHSAGVHEFLDLVRQEAEPGPRDVGNSGAE
ncbi:MAG TPA: hypothetical protein VHQ65_14085, partial [Thermoanaerobaculia bacterium]|nr:hypothetical protein [Thermoanaerobaculia bacterium]